ncbi:hypothetical protein AAKU55_001006 [Oxalobacteraceae bacterium GrIS 1.11]
MLPVQKWLSSTGTPDLRHGGASVDAPAVAIWPTLALNRTIAANKPAEALQRPGAAAAEQPVRRAGAWACHGGYKPSAACMRGKIKAQEGEPAATSS